MSDAAAGFVRLARHLEIEKAILKSGGRLVASFELDADGRTVGAPSTHNRRAHCSECGEPGHISRRCRGVGEAPAPLYERRLSPKWIESAKRRITRADHDLQTARVEIARRIAAKGKK